MKDLIEAYTKRLETLENTLGDLSDNPTESTSRLKIKIGCYRSFLNDLKQGQTLPLDSVSVSDFSLLAKDKDFQQQLLNRWGFTEDGAANATQQLKIFSLLDWMEQHSR